MAERRRMTQSAPKDNKKENKKKSTTAPKKAEEPKKEKRQRSAEELTLLREVSAVGVIAVGILLVLGFYFNALGWFGEAIKKLALGLFGVWCYALPVVFVLFGIFFMFRNNQKRRKAWYLLGIFISVNGFVHLLSAVSGASFLKLYEYGLQGYGGGLLGGSLVLMFSFIGKVGTGVVFLAAIAIFVILFTGITPIETLRNYIQAKREERYEEKRAGKAEKEKEIVFEVKEKRIKGEKAKEENKAEEAEEEIDFKIFTHDQLGVSDALPEDKKEKKKEEKVSAEELMANEMGENLREKPMAEKPEKKKEEEEGPPVSTDEIAKEIEEAKPLFEYKFPPLDLLTEKKGDSGTPVKSEDLRESAKKLIDTLKSFGVEAKVLEVSRGPAVTRFEIQPSAGVKVSKIVNLADDIALNLAAYGVRIEAPIPGKAAVGIEIPNKAVSMVSLKEVIGSKEFQSFKSKTAFALGKDISGKPIISDISKMPHLLIAGTTGSGKSVCINTLITSIIYKASPDEVKLLMIDPKVVELGVYNGIPHLLIPVVTDPRKAAGALNWAVTEMVKRYKTFADCNVRDIAGYNEYAETEGLRKLEKIVIIIDELSDLMMVAPHDVEDAICRLAQMARAAGMHLVIATQRPSVDVITGLIKANVPSRIAFTVSNQIDSRTILDMMGAEKLLGRGDMLFLPVGASKPTRIQGAFVSDKEVEHIVEFIKGDYEPDYDEDILEKIENGDKADADEDDGGDCDELLNQAIEMVVDCGQASVSLVQRKLKVGYARAGRIIDQMETRGIVGPHEGSKPRQVLITKAQFYEMMMQKDDESGGEEE